MNGLAEFRGHASRSNGYEVNSSDGARSLQRAIEPIGFLRCRWLISVGGVHLLRRPVRRASGSGSRGPEFRTRARPAFPRAHIRNSAQIAETDGYGDWPTPMPTPQNYLRAMVFPQTPSAPVLAKPHPGGGRTSLDGLTGTVHHRATSIAATSLARAMCWIRCCHHSRFASDRKP